MISSLQSINLQTGHIIEVAVYLLTNFYVQNPSFLLMCTKPNYMFLFLLLLVIVREPGKGLIRHNVGQWEKGEDDKSDSQVEHFTEAAKKDQWRYFIILH